MTAKSGSPDRPSDRRKLVAIMYADMVGYSRLIGLDDAGTLGRLRALRREVSDPALAATLFSSRSTVSTGPCAVP